jgi:hypothetical protein
MHRPNLVAKHRAGRAKMTRCGLDSSRDRPICRTRRGCRSKGTRGRRHRRIVASPNRAKSDDRGCRELLLVALGNVCRLAAGALGQIRDCRAFPDCESPSSSGSRRASRAAGVLERPYEKNIYEHWELCATCVPTALNWTDTVHTGPICEPPKTQVRQALPYSAELSNRAGAGLRTSRSGVRISPGALPSSSNALPTSASGMAQLGSGLCVSCATANDMIM